MFACPILPVDMSRSIQGSYQWADMTKHLTSALSPSLTH